jgi:hypothetical protein
MKKILLAVILIVCCAVPASAAPSLELSNYFSAQYFTWEEFNAGKRLLKESGPLFAEGFLFGATASSVSLRVRGEVFGGVVNYDGQTQAPASVVVQTHVNYFGGRVEPDLGFRIEDGNLRLEPFAGLGYRLWLRNLQDSTSATGQAVSGYTETWQTGYSRLGVRGRYHVPSGLAVYAEGGLKYPFYTGNSVDFANSGKTTFHPGARSSGFAEAGISWRRLKVGLSYEGFRFSQSPLVTNSSGTFFQPESKSDIFGLNIGWIFR